MQKSFLHALRKDLSLYSSVKDRAARVQCWKIVYALFCWFSGVKSAMQVKGSLSKVSLRTTILFFVGVIIFIVLGANTIVYIQDFRQNYLEAVEWRSEALAQGIINQIANNQEYDPNYYVNNPGLLVAFSLQCIQLYELNQEKHVAHISIIDGSGTISAHNEKALWGKSIESDTLRRHLDQHNLVTFLDDTTYHTLIPFFSPQNDYLGSIDIGFPKNVVNEKLQESLLHTAILFGLSLLLTIFIISLLTHLIVTKPIGQLVTVGCQLAEGNLVPNPLGGAKGKEISMLGTVFESISTYFRHIADIAGHITTGVLEYKVRVRSEHDMLGNAVQGMLEYLNLVATGAARIAEGDLTEQVQVRSDKDMFGRGIQAMVEGLRSIIVQIRTSSEQIAATGSHISSLAARDIEIVQSVNTSADQVMSTMQELGASVQQVAQNMENLSSTVSQTSASVSQMTSSIGHIAVNTNALKAQTHQTITSLNEAVTSLAGVVESTEASKKSSQDTIQDALEGQQSVEHIMNSMEDLQKTITTAVNVITGFARRSHDITGILDVIREIADRTSLLALNASIIAAQAGVHGRGFAVVADEIKNLAGGVTTSTTDIATIVQSLQQDTASVVQTIHAGAANVEQSIKRTHDARGVLQKIITSAQRSSTVVTQIADALHELKQTAHTVVSAMEQVDSMTDDMTSSTNEQRATTTQINETIAYINDMASQIKRATTDQAKGIHDVLFATTNVSALMAQNLQSSQHIADTTQELSSQAELLLSSVDRFKLGS